MAITNLTNTKWTFNETLSFESGFEWSINFNSVALVPSYMGGGEKTSFYKLKTELISYMGNACGMSYWADVGMSLNVYQATWNSNYANENSRTIEIVGGEDVSNPDLIAFLEANAVMEVQIDLTGTTWLFKEEISGNGDFYVDFKSNNQTGDNITIAGSQVEYWLPENTLVRNENGWTDRAYRTITITGGDDVQNPELISFLLSNAINPIDDLSEYLTSVADAVRELKNTTEPIHAQFIPHEIKNITSVQKFIDVRGCQGIFYYSNLTASQVEEFLNYSDTSKYDSFRGTFSHCYNLKRVPNLDFSKGRIFNGMFEESGLEETHTLNIDKAIDMSYMFYGCDSLKKVDLSKIPSSCSIDAAFANCGSLTTIIIRTMDAIPSCTTSTFSGCSSLTHIYVPDEWVEELKASDKWSNFADIIVPLSTLEE